MNTGLQNKILDAFKLHSKTRQKSLKDGSIIEYKFVTFMIVSEYVKQICAENNEKYPGPREVKRQLIAMIDNGQVGEIFGEPPILMLKEEFAKYAVYQKDIGVA
jgi:hypothetical protein